MKFGISLGSFPRLVQSDFEKLCEQAQYAGYEGIEYMVAEEDLEVGAEFEQKYKKLKEIADSYNLETPTVFTGLFWTYNPVLPETKEKALKVIEAELKAASILGSRVILVVPAVAVSELDYEEHYRRTIDFLRTAGSMARDYDVIVGVENVWNRVFAGPLEFRKLLDEVNHEYVKAYFDVGNTLPHSLPEHWIGMLGDYIVAVHVKGFSVVNLRFGVPLMGSINWKAVNKAFKEIDYDWYVIAEVPPYEGDPFKAIYDAKTSLDVIFKEK